MWPVAVFFQHNTKIHNVSRRCCCRLLLGDIEISCAVCGHCLAKHLLAINAALYNSTLYNTYMLIVNVCDKYNDMHWPMSGFSLANTPGLRQDCQPSTSNVARHAHSRIIVVVGCLFGFVSPLEKINKIIIFGTPNE